MKDQLKELEKIIVRNRGLDSFYETGRALWAINKKKLYKQRYKTFNTYCDERLDMKSCTAYQLINAAKVIDTLRNCADSLPANEAQARALTKLKSAQQQIEVWSYVIKNAPNGKITAKFIEKVVEQYLGINTRKKQGQQVEFVDLILQAISICKKIDEKSKLINNKQKFLEILKICEERLEDSYECLIEVDQAFLTFPFVSNINMMVQFWLSWRDKRSKKKCHKRKKSGRHYQTSTSSDDLDVYQILGIDPSATQNEVKKAFRKSVKMYHPDSLGSLNIGQNHEWIQDEAEKRMKSIIRAYEKLRK